MIELIWTGTVVILVYLSLVIFGVDSRDGDDWHRHLR